MSCETWESMIALDAGGDLPAADAERLTRHLETCVDCQRLVSEMRESQRAVALLADAPVPEEILATVRAGVLGTVGKRSALVPFRLPPRRLALAATLAVALGALLLLRSSDLDPEPPVDSIEELEAPAPPRPVAEVPAVQQPTTDPRSLTADPESAEPTATDRLAAVSTPIEAPILQPPKPLPPVTVAPVNQAAPPATAQITDATSARPPATEPMIIKLVSDDADVVIYWLVNTPLETTKETKDEKAV